MIPLLVWVPVATSVILGVVYLFFGDSGPGFKILGTAVFFAAVYFQFFSRHFLLGFLLQIGLPCHSPCGAN